MMCDRRLWMHQAGALPQPVSYGDTTSADNFSDMARTILAGAPPRFAVAGLSMGGILAFELWRQAPERITHLALLDTNPHAESPERRSQRLQQIADALHGGLRDLAINSMKPLYLAECNRNDETLLGTVLDMALGLGADVFERQSLALRNRIDSVPTLATITCPTLVLCGAEDRLCPVAYHSLMASEIPDARLTVVDNCGHLSTLECPAIVTHELQWLLSR